MASTSHIERTPLTRERRSMIHERKSWGIRKRSKRVLEAGVADSSFSCERRVGSVAASKRRLAALRHARASQRPTIQSFTDRATPSFSASFGVHAPSPLPSTIFHSLTIMEFRGKPKCRVVFPSFSLVVRTHLLRRNFLQIYRPKALLSWHTEPHLALAPYDAPVSHQTDDDWMMVSHFGPEEPVYLLFTSRGLLIFGKKLRKTKTLCSPHLRLCQQL